MNKIFFLLENKIQSGPFSLDEIKSMGIKDHVFVWSENLGQWTNVLSVDELKEYVIKTPPKIKSVNKSEIADLVVKYFKVFLLSIVLVIPVSFICSYLGGVSNNFNDFIRSYVYHTYDNVGQIDDDIFGFTFILFIVLILLDNLVKGIKWVIINRTK